MDGAGASGTGAYGVVTGSASRGYDVSWDSSKGWTDVLKFTGASDAAVNDGDI
ncbi:hypothetical protein JCM19239_1441 [Vibrio variabilis]|uniref:Uncharacterized protein n=1 Tax=Vibrio variabilis TaxID=990271 RepID=A0ABQ0JG27_9VIBR|nr:hypothetical protein JCM19239_1441 [Vibrio variabilis]